MNNFKDRVVYQIYPKSFRDVNGDGFGDIKGITEKIEYFKYLGVDYLWITPFFSSPQNDNGYDVSNYYTIEPMYGTMEDVEELIEKAEQVGIGIMLDMVFNHTSTEHEWFKRAMNGEQEYKDYYIFKKGNGSGEPPTNWESKFGGNAWEYVPEFDEYYLHLFDRTQADLNWKNPKVRQALVDVIKFWKAKGVKGYRFDVINLISKPDQYESDLEGVGKRFYTDGPNVHEYLKEMVKEAGIEDMITVGEMSATDIKNCVKYSNPAEKELSMCFNFHHLKVDYKNQNKWELQNCDFKALKELLFSWQEGMQEGNGWNALFWSNHDQPRVLSRFGDDKHYVKESAKMLATMMYLLRGTPYVYQGEEIGMTNAGFVSLDQYKDVESMNHFKLLKAQGLCDEEIYGILRERSRDNSRTPMQWNQEKGGGFGTATPWISMNPNYIDINVESEQSDENSILNFYRQIIKLRKTYKVISEGIFRPLEIDCDGIFAYERILPDQKLAVICNFDGENKSVTIDLPEGDYELLLTNYDRNRLDPVMDLKPYEAIAFIKK